VAKRIGWYDRVNATFACMCSQLWDQLEVKMIQLGYRRRPSFTAFRRLAVLKMLQHYLEHPDELMEDIRECDEKFPGVFPRRRVNNANKRRQII